MRSLGGLLGSARSRRWVALLASLVWADCVRWMRRLKSSMDPPRARAIRSGRSPALHARRRSGARLTSAISAGCASGILVRGSEPSDLSCSINCLSFAGLDSEYLFRFAAGMVRSECLVQGVLDWVIIDLLQRALYLFHSFVS